MSAFLHLFQRTIDSLQLLVGFYLVDMLEGPITRALKVLERGSLDQRVSAICRARLTVC